MKYLKSMSMKVTYYCCQMKIFIIYMMKLERKPIEKRFL